MRLSIGVKLALGFGLVSALTLVGAAFVATGVSRLSRATDQLAAIIGPTTDGVYEIRVEVASASAALRGLLLAETDAGRTQQRETWAAAHDALAKARESLARLEARWSEVNLRADTRELSSQLDVWKSAQTRIIELERRPDRPEDWRTQALAIQATQAGPAVEVIRAKLAELGRAVSAIEEGAFADAQTLKTSLRRVVLIEAVVMPVLGVVIGVVLSRAMASRIRRLLNQAEDVASGKLYVTSGVKAGGDELADLSRAVDRMAASLRDFALNLSGHSMNLAAAGAEVASSADSLATTVNNQASRMTTLSASVEEMSASAVSVADNVRQVADEAGQTGNLAETGSTMIQSAAEGVRDTCTRIGGAATSVKELERRVESVRELLASINDIAEQTNLLALNAAIEAARAGEHGRGFAVVADEVRKLADRTTSITAEISSSIGAIRESMQSTAKTIEESVSQATRGAEASESAATQLESIRSSTRQVATLVQSIAQAAREQAAAVEDIRRSIMQANDECQTTKANSEHSSLAAAEISAEAEKLCAIVKHLKVTRREYERARVPGLTWDRGEVIDLSANGARLKIESGERLTSGQKFALTLRDRPGTTASVNAEVAWIGSAADGRLAGVRFSSISAEAERAISAWLHASMLNSADNAHRRPATVAA